MPIPAGPLQLGTPGPTVPASSESLAQGLVDVNGGRYSSQLGIDVDRGGREIDRWALAATLFGARISAAIAARTFRVFEENGVGTLADAGARTWAELVELLDKGGYTRYDFRTATKLQRLADVIERDFGGRFAAILETEDAARLEATLRALPGWGPATVQLFLRELRGVLSGAEPPLDARAEAAARHLCLLGDGVAETALPQLRRVAERVGLDFRDLESALVRVSLRHARGYGDCPGGRRCRILREEGPYR